MRNHTNQPTKRKTTMSYRPVFIINGDICYNGQFFATEEEALSSAEARFRVWTMPEDFGAERAPDTVNYLFDPDKGDVSLASLKAPEAA
jgi:hypothetical protein